MKKIKKLKEKEGITLVALVVTIVILLILVGIAIATLTGENGLLTRAQQAKKLTINAQDNENLILGDYEEKIDEIVGSRDTVTISKEEYEALKNSNSYATTEKEVGTWIDGSKLYRVTINKTMQFSGADWYAFDLGLSKYNIKQLVNVDYCSINKTTEVEAGAVYNFLMSFVNGDILNVYLSTNDEIMPDCVTLTYTKLDY